MLQIVIPATELFDERTLTFTYTKEQTLRLEHSLVSLSKWESKWCKPFLSSDKSDEEIVDYIKCMTLTQNVKPEVYDLLTPQNIAQINEYINAPMTATTFREQGKGKKSREIITAEIIYYWMITLGIPFECQKWHINSLLTLIRVCEIKNQPKKKGNKQDTYNRYRALNEARRQKLNSKG